ncbi:MAG: LptF/LptG family permease [Syntrophorhabdaceae bacterium]|nr:LptF/LptG family permease [Syntrophorhabdaceae bacterium]
MTLSVGFLNKKIYRYILKESLYIFLLSLGILTFIMILSRIGRIADLVINKGVFLKDIFLLVVYSSPPFLTFTLPMSFLLSTIVTLGRLSSENEILVLKASGVDLRCLFYPIGIVAVAITILGLVNTTLLLPKGGELFRNTLLDIVKKGISLDDKEGIFNDTIPGVVIYIDKVDTENKVLAGIMVSDDRDKDVKQMISASKGLINFDPVTLDLVFIFEKGNLHRWEKKSDIYRSLSFKNYTFSLNLSNILPTNVSLRKRPHEMNIGELRRAASKAEPSDRYDLLLEIYKKFSLPFSSIAFTFLIIPLGVKRRGEGKFSGIIYSLLLFVFYYVVMAFSENAGKAINIPTFFVVWIPNLVIVILGLKLTKELNSEEKEYIVQKIKHILGYYLEKAK